MRVSGLRAIHYLSTIEGRKDFNITTVKGNCKTDVMLTNAYISYHGEELNYKPYLMMQGRIEKIYGNFGYGVDEVDFSEKEQPIFMGCYEFNHIELLALVDKGYYEQGFNIPANFINDAIFEFDVPMSVSVLEPDESGVPIVFADTQSTRVLEFDSVNSGYILSDYFDDFVRENATEITLDNIDKVLDTEYETLIDLTSDIDLIQLDDGISHNEDLAITADEEFLHSIYSQDMEEKKIKNSDAKILKLLDEVKSEIKESLDTDVEEILLEDEKIEVEKEEEEIVKKEVQLPLMFKDSDDEHEYI